MKQKNIITHLFAFITGALVTYIYIDMKNPGNLAPNPIEREKVISQEDRKDLFLNSIQGMLKQQMDKMELSQDDLEVFSHELEDLFVVRLKASNINRDSINISIVGGRVFLSGRIEKKSENSFVVSSFEREVRIPKEFDTEKPQIINDDDNITIKFKRKN